MTTQPETPASGTEVEPKVFTLEGAPLAVVNLCKRLSLNSTFDTATAQIEIMAAIQEAETLDEIFAAANAGSLSGEDYVDRPFLLHSDNFEWKRSASQFIKDGGFPFYALMRVRDLTDQKEKVVSCGGYGFVSTLDAISRRGFLEQYDDQGGMPLVIKSKPTASGYNVLLLAPAPVMPSAPR